MSLNNVLINVGIPAIAVIGFWPQLKFLLSKLPLPWLNSKPVDDDALDAEAFARLLSRAASKNPEAAKALIDMRAKLLGAV